MARGFGGLWVGSGSEAYLDSDKAILVVASLGLRAFYFVKVVFIVCRMAATNASPLMGLLK